MGLPNNEDREQKNLNLEREILRLKSVAQEFLVYFMDVLGQEMCVRLEKEFKVKEISYDPHAMV